GTESPECVSYLLGNRLPRSDGGEPPCQRMEQRSLTLDSNCFNLIEAHSILGLLVLKNMEDFPPSLPCFQEVYIDHEQHLPYDAGKCKLRAVRLTERQRVWIHLSV